MLKTYDYKEVDRKLKTIKSVLILRNQGKTFREINKKVGLTGSQSNYIWHTNKDYSELQYLFNTPKQND